MMTTRVKTSWRRICPFCKGHKTLRMKTRRTRMRKALTRKPMGRTAMRKVTRLASRKSKIVMRTVTHRLRQRQAMRTRQVRSEHVLVRAEARAVHSASQACWQPFSRGELYALASASLGCRHAASRIRAFLSAARCAFDDLKTQLTLYTFAFVQAVRAQRNE